MKKIIVFALITSLFSGCENEPLDSDFSVINNPTDPSDPNSNSDDLSLSSYSFDVNSVLPLFGPFETDIDFTMNTNNKVATFDTESIIFGTTIASNGIVTRDTSGKIISFKSFEGTSQTNETTITYLGDAISQISYDDFEDDTEDYTYSFTTSGNEITKTEAGSNINVIYTFDNTNKLIKKESFDAGISIQLETLSYDSSGNCIAVVLTGDNAGNTTYGFDSNLNPLKTAFSDQYLISILNDEDDAIAGSNIVQFHSENNWSSITTPDGLVSFTIQYNAANRIINRSGSFDLGDGVTINQDETFNYVN